MFALRSVPHETTGFSPAELVYGRALRSPLGRLREAWVGRGEDPTVVQYMLELLELLDLTQKLAAESAKLSRDRVKPYYIAVPNV